MEKQDAVANTRASAKLKKRVEEFIRLDTHLNESDLVRDSLREKIRRGAPGLYKRLF